MISLRRVLILSAMSVLLTGCLDDDGDGKVTISEACQVAYKIFYQRDGSFTFTDEEVSHLRDVNVDKISDFKRWFKQECPKEYALTKGGRKKKS